MTTEKNIFDKKPSQIVGGLWFFGGTLVFFINYGYTYGYFSFPTIFSCIVLFCLGLFFWSDKYDI